MTNNYNIQAKVFTGRSRHGLTGWPAPTDRKHKSRGRSWLPRTWGQVLPIWRPLTLYQDVSGKTWICHRVNSVVNAASRLSTIGTFMTGRRCTLQTH